MRRFILLLLLTGAADWATMRHYHQQSLLHQQIMQLMAVLTTENDLVSRNAEGTIKDIEAAAAKNRNQPTDLALLRRAEALQTQVKQLVNLLQTSDDQLRRATGNKENQPLRRPGASIGTELSEDAPRRQALEQRLTAYADTLRQLNLLDAKTTALQAPAFNNNTPVAEALADLTRLESEVLAHQAHALQSISKRVGAQRWLTHPLAIATAQSNVAAPGDTYRAQLGLVGYISANEVKMQMACNGRPVPADSVGVGQVRFRAPTRPSPATWTGTIRLNQNGRDTTFRVTVPYRVARR
jgi:hypothetical protein